ALFNIEAPYCIGKKEPYDLSLVRSEWQKQLSLEEINQALISRRHVHPEVRVIRLSIPSGNRGAGGRVRGVDLYLNNGSVVYLDGTKFRQALSLGSLMFDLIAEQPA